MILPILGDGREGQYNSGSRRRTDTYRSAASVLEEFAAGQPRIRDVMVDFYETPTSNPNAPVEQRKALIKLIDLHPNVFTTRTLTAAHLAANQARGVFRKDRVTPEYVHSLEVDYMVGLLCDDPETASSIAVVHDLTEALIGKLDHCPGEAPCLGAIAGMYRGLLRSPLWSDYGKELTAAMVLTGVPQTTGSSEYRKAAKWLQREFLSAIEGINYIYPVAETSVVDVADALVNARDLGYTKGAKYESDGGARERARVVAKADFAIRGVQGTKGMPVGLETLAGEILDSIREEHGVDPELERDENAKLTSPLAERRTNGLDANVREYIGSFINSPFTDIALPTNDGMVFLGPY